MRLCRYEQLSLRYKSFARLKLIEREFAFANSLLYYKENKLTNFICNVNIIMKKK